MFFFSIFLKVLSYPSFPQSYLFFEPFRKEPKNALNLLKPQIKMHFVTLGWDWGKRG